jgi:hypothetical protein
MKLGKIIISTLILFFVSFLVFFFISGNKHQAIKKEDKITELKVFRYKAYLYTLNGKKVGDELFCYLDIRQNVYFNTHEEHCDPGLLIKDFALSFDESLKNSSLTSQKITLTNSEEIKTRVSFLDSDGFVIHSQTIRPVDLQKNPKELLEEYSWGYNVRFANQLGKDKINRITDVLIEPLMPTKLDSSMDEALKLIGQLSIKIKSPEYHELRFQKTRSTAPEEDWSYEQKQSSK